MDPDNELYDAACELLQAAQRVDHASQGEGLHGVVPGTIGCVESSLGALARAIEARQISVSDAPARGSRISSVRCREQRPHAVPRARSTAVAQPDRR